MTLRIFENTTLNTELSTFFTEDGEIFFRGKDIAMALGYKDVDQAVRIHVSEKHKVSYKDVATGENYPVDLTGYTRVDPRSIFIKEPGLYELIFSSHLPAARNFRDWVFEEVLPSIRKTGRYILEDPISKISSIGVDELCAYDKEQRKEYKAIALSHYNLLKDKRAKRLGRIGGLVTQKRARQRKEMLGYYEELAKVMEDERAAW